MASGKPRIGISSCLLGQQVRYDGGHKRDRCLTQTLGRFVEWVPVCPEVEVGMGVPRERVRLVGSARQPRMIGEQSGKDWTAAMQRYAQARVAQLAPLRLSGYVLKSKSPSCGMERVRVYGRSGVVVGSGRGLFAIALTVAYPLLPVEEEGRLGDPALCGHFIERAFAYQQWQALVSGAASLHTLVAFHASHKLLIMTHSEGHMRRLGRLVAEANSRPLRVVLEEYGRCFMDALQRCGRPRASRRTRSTYARRSLRSPRAGGSGRAVAGDPR